VFASLDLILHNIDMPVRRLIYEEIAPGRAFHAALVEPGRNAKEHTHDFAEIMLVLQGAGDHWVNGAVQPLEPGLMLLVRPSDTHVIRPHRGLFFVNVAFPVDRWAALVGAFGLSADWLTWQRGSEPSPFRIAPQDRAECETAAFRVVSDFHAGGGSLHLARFLGSVLPSFVDRPSLPPLIVEGPRWLELALEAMHEPSNLSLGLPRLLEIAGVSLPHLCRTMRARLDRSPTQFLNDLRMHRAATLLSTTRMEIREIVTECGIENVSYFYRQFRQRYQISPLQYRRREAGRLA